MDINQLNNQSFETSHLIRKAGMKYVKCFPSNFDSTPKKSANKNWILTFYCEDKFKIQPAFTSSKSTMKTPQQYVELD